MIDVEEFKARCDYYQQQTEKRREHETQLRRELQALCTLTGYNARFNAASFDSVGETVSVYDDEGNLIIHGPTGEVLHQLAAPPDDAPFGLFQQVRFFQP